LTTWAVYLPETNLLSGIPLEVLSDNSLMMKVKNGDLDLLGLLFERYHKMLFTFFYRIHFSSEVSEDLVQNVFIRIIKYRRGFNGEGSFKVWMFHIARNISHDHFKGEKKKGYKEDIQKWEERITDYSDVKDKEEKDIQLSMLHSALENLEPKKRELIVMSKLDGMKYRDIAEFYNVSEGNIKIRVFRALKDLKTAYTSVQEYYDREA